MAIPAPIKPPLYVVHITGTAANGAAVQGTGFVVSAQGHVATCRHVVHPMGDEEPLTQLCVSLPYPFLQPVSYEVAASSSEHDLAVLASTVPLTSPVQQAMLHENWAEDTHVGDEVTVWGYSAAEHYTHAQHVACAIRGFSEVNGSIGLGADINAGDSGGPVLDRDRRVIGIVYVRDGRRAGHAMAVPVSLLRALLRKSGVVAGPGAGGSDAVFFQVPKAPTYKLAGRGPLLEDLKREVSQGQHVALCFTPGVGKSAVATVLANDHEVRAHFESGVLWARLNRKPNVLSELKKWATAIRLPAEKMQELEQLASDPNATSEEAEQLAALNWTRALEQHIGSRRMLLVVDDAWELKPAQALLLEAPNCVHVLTTREKAKVAGNLGNCAVHELSELTEHDGVAFLRELAPCAVEMFPGEARAVFHDVGGLPQGLFLLGTHLRQAGERRRRIEDAFRHIRESFRECTEPLQHAIRLSYDALPDDATRRALEALAIFRPKPGKFSEEAALAVLDGPVGLIDNLSDAGLVEDATTSTADGERDPPYTMHRTIAEFARGELPPGQERALHRRAMEYFGRRLRDYEETQQDPGSYGYQYRYEIPEWQDAMDDFLYHLARAGEPAEAVVEFGSIYINAFWWWGCYADFPFCTRLLQQASTKRLSEEARRAFDLLVAFDAAYPKETQRQAGGNWEGVHDALTRLRALGGLDGDLRTGASDVVRHTRALTDIFLAEACRFRRSSDNAEAERLYREALDLLPGRDWSRPWAMYHLGDLCLDTGRNEEAWRMGAECLALAESPELSLKDRDNEVIANAWRLRAESAERLGRQDDALQGLERMVLHAYAFQAIPEPPDAYTVAFYRQVTGRAARFLQGLHRREPARALAWCGALYTYWASYRELSILEERAASLPEVQAMLEADPPDALCGYLFPPAPAVDATHQRGSRYCNEAIAIFNEKMGTPAGAAPIPA